jgi:hypothetical protein
MVRQKHWEVQHLQGGLWSKQHTVVGCTVSFGIVIAQDKFDHLFFV